MDFLPNLFGEAALAPEGLPSPRPQHFRRNRDWHYLQQWRFRQYAILFADTPLYALTQGEQNLELLPLLYLDISCYYRYQEKVELTQEEKDVDTGTVFLGATVRLAL